MTVFININGFISSNIIIIINFPDIPSYSILGVGGRLTQKEREVGDERGRGRGRERKTGRERGRRKRGVRVNLCVYIYIYIHMYTYEIERQRYMRCSHCDTHTCFI